MTDDLGNYARALRNAPTPFEAILWRHLSRSQLGGYKFRRQAVIDHMICDFFCPAKGLIVEIDGDTHDPAADAARDQTLLLKHHFTTVRFSNAEIAQNPDGVLTTILSTLAGLSNRWGGPHPNPSPEGEGLRS